MSVTLRRRKSTAKESAYPPELRNFVGRQSFLLIAIGEHSVSPEYTREQVCIGSMTVTSYFHIHNRYHSWFNTVTQLKGYYDLFLITPTGDVVYTMFKEKDFASNLSSGTWTDTGLARAFRKSMSAEGKEGAVFVDFEAYEPSNLEPAAFLSRRITKSGRTIGVIALQMPIGRIREIMQTTAGMGDTGETYIVGPDYLMRSDSRFSEDTSILKTEVRTEAVERALNGETGSLTISDYRGEPVLSAFRPFGFLGADWVMLAEQDVAEVQSPIDEMLVSIVFISVTIALIIGTAGLILARSITQPLALLSQSVAKFRESRQAEHLADSSRPDEIGDIARGFHAAANEVASYIDDINSARDELKAGESELRDREERIRLLLEVSPIGFSLTRLTGELLFSNAALRKTIRLEADDAMPSDMADLYIDKDDRSQMVGTLVRDGEVSAVETTWRAVNGELIWITISAKIIDYDGDQAILSWIDDITVRKQVEHEMHSQRQALAAVLENTVQAIVAVDKDLNLIVCNKKFQELLQLPDELTEPGTTTRAMVERAAEVGFYGDGDKEELVETRMAALSSGKPLSVEISTADGLIWFATLQPDDDGGFVMTYTDITERKLAEQRMSELASKLAKYLSPQVYESIFSGEQDVTISTSRKKLTVFFSDIKDFTATTEDLEPEELTFLLNDYLTKMTEIALEYGATIDKYVGDAMLLFFGDPATNGVKEDALACVKMAVAMQQRMADLQAKWKDFGHRRQFRMRIGINTGFCNVGNFGSEDRMDYTIIGGEVNLAARLEGISDPDGIMLAGETYALVKDEFVADEQEPIQVKGISRDIIPYKVMGIFDNPNESASYIRSEDDAMRLYVDLRKLDAEGRAKAAEELEQKAKQLRDING
jgi:PAS domain S-box-containing protein